MHQSAALVLDACFTLPLMRDSVGRSIILTIVREKNSHQIIMNLIESKVKMTDVFSYALAIFIFVITLQVTKVAFTTADSIGLMYRGE